MEVVMGLHVDVARGLCVRWKGVFLCALLCALCAAHGLFLVMCMLLMYMLCDAHNTQFNHLYPHQTHPRYTQFRCNCMKCCTTWRKTGGMANAVMLTQGAPCVQVQVNVRATWSTRPPIVEMHASNVIRVNGLRGDNSLHPGSIGSCSSRWVTGEVMGDVLSLLGLLMYHSPHIPHIGCCTSCTRHPQDTPFPLSQQDIQAAGSLGRKGGLPDPTQHDDTTTTSAQEQATRQQQQAAADEAARAQRAAAEAAAARQQQEADEEARKMQAEAAVEAQIEQQAARERAAALAEEQAAQQRASLFSDGSGGGTTNAGGGEGDGKEEKKEGQHTPGSDVLDATIEVRGEVLLLVFQHGGTTCMVPTQASHTPHEHIKTGQCA